jgi:hypothetical protein
MKIVLIIGCIAFSLGLPAQRPAKLKFKREGQFYFFKKGSPADTVIRNVSDQFYLLVPDSLKPWISVRIDNARVTSTKNDSLLQLKYLPGMRYELLYTASDSSFRPVEAGGRAKLQARCLVNGASQIPKNKVKIEIRNMKEENSLLINEFFYRDN